MVLSLWYSHCSSLHNLFDDCRTRVELVVLVGCCHLHPPLPLIIFSVKTIPCKDEGHSHKFSQFTAQVKALNHGFYNNYKLHTAMHFGNLKDFFISGFHQ